MPDVRARLQHAVGESYRIERELGGGGMSRVFVAEEIRFARQVVLKLLPPETAAELSAARFEREIGLAARLQQANIVPVLAAGDADGLPWYSMPYVEGESLRARLDRAPIPASECVTILRDVARALAYAHAHGVVHRDIKPENILLSGGAAVVTDFGIAKALQASRTRPSGSTTDEGRVSLTSAGLAIGTPAYMAPEQAAGDPDVDQRADLYAWGMIGYEMLGGHHPFERHTTPQQLIAAQFGELPAPLRTGTSGVPRTLGTLVMRCLEKDPAARPPSANALLAELDGPGASRIGRPTQLGVGATIAVLALAAAGLARSHLHTVRGAEAAPPTMLAVLPFEHVGPADQSIFTDGLTDAVTAKLAALPGVGVIDRRSASQYRQTTKTPRQIGSELGVAYLVQGMVRWARDSADGWRAQVTPSLVDAATGITRWTGEPLVVTPHDPFAAQGEIATRVASALRLNLQPAERAGLAHRVTDSPDAFAAYQRGIAYLDARGRTGDELHDIRRAEQEFARAVSLDSSFAPAWGELASTRYMLANAAPDDPIARSNLRSTLAAAQRHAAGLPRLLLTMAFVRTFLDHDTTGVDTLITRAVAGAPNDAAILKSASIALRLRLQLDSAAALARRAAALDPRSGATLENAGSLAASMRRWDEARRYANALIALDARDERGWALLVIIAAWDGDTLEMQRVLTRTLAAVPHPGIATLGDMAYAGGDFGPRFARLAMSDLQIETFADSVNRYYDSKADVFVRRGETARARVYFDSLRALLTTRDLHDDPGMLLERALVEAVYGERTKAHATLARAMTVVRPIASRADLTDQLDPLIVAKVYTRLGEPAMAVQWMEACITNPAGLLAPQVFANDPTIRMLRGTPEFEAFLRRHGLRAGAAPAPAS